MKEVYFVTATNTDVGKTYACETFIRQLAQDGKKIGYLKPFETGVLETPQDGTKLLKIVKLLNKEFNFTINDVVPYQFKLPSAPFVAALNENIVIDINLIIKTIDKMLTKCDVLIIEGAGGLYVPILKNYFIIDLIKQIEEKYNSTTFLISPSSLGSINDTLLSQNLLQQYKIKYKWYINLYKDKDNFHNITLPFYTEYFKIKDYTLLS